MTHTPGPWRYEYSSVVTDAPVKKNRTYGYGCGPNFVADLNDGEYHEYSDGAEQDANGRLIAEAGTVAHETGLTPRQLADQRAELLEALECCREELRCFEDEAVSDYSVGINYDSFWNAIRRADTLIQRARGE